MSAAPRRAVAIAAAIACAALAMTPVPARAGGVLLGGWEGDGLDQGYGYAAVGGRWPGAGPVGIVGRVQASYLYYRFDEAGGRTKVWSPGVTALAGPSLSGAAGSTTVLAGLDLRRERRDRASGTTRENQTALQLAWEVSPDVGPHTRAWALAQYSFANDYMYGRASLGRQVTNLSWTAPVTLVLGVEGVGQGNHESDAWQAGGYGELDLPRAHMSLTLHGGYKSAGSPGEARESTWYAGAGVYASR